MVEDCGSSEGGGDLTDRWGTSSGADEDLRQVKLEDALEDPSGLYMNAGATMLFYQRTTAPLELAEIPPLLAVRHFLRFVLCTADIL